MVKVLFVLLSICSYCQQTQIVDFKTVSGSIKFNSSSKSVIGEANYVFDLLAKTDTISIDAKNMIFTEVRLNGKIIPITNTKKELKFAAPAVRKNYKLHLKYHCQPKQTLYFVGQNEDLQIWTQGQGKYTSHWFPSFDDVNEKVVFNLDITYDNKFQVVSNGILTSKVVKGSDFVWKYRMHQPMSSYLLMITIGKFDSKTVISKSGIPLQMYYQPADSLKFEPTYRYSKQLFDFLETEIGVAYPWQIYKQIPVKDFLYAGMENTSATVFSQDYVVDNIGFNDKNYVNVNAHELAHQWFGNLVTAKSGKDHWLQEGFATYYALLAEEDIFGSDYFNWKMYEMAEKLQQASKTDTIPILNEKASSLTFYQKGAWALHYLRDNIGNEKFKKAVINYLNKKKLTNVITDDFLIEINKVSNFDTNTFRKDWLESSTFNVRQALAILQKSAMIQDYFAVAELKDIPLNQKVVQFEKILSSNAYYPIKQEIIYQLQEIPFEEKKELLKLVLQSKDLQLRQAVAATFTTVPEQFKTDYSTLLFDKSYVTNEIALNNLWHSFAAGQITLLEKTKDFVGFNDKNLRILWLTLALRTKDFQQSKKLDYYQELLNYASTLFETSIRQNALNNLIYLDKNDENYLPFLIEGLVSHKWQMVKFSKDKIRAMFKNKSHRTYFENKLSKISAPANNQLQQLINEK